MHKRTPLFYKKTDSLALFSIVDQVGLRLLNPKHVSLSTKISGVNTLRDAGPNDITFFHNIKYKDVLSQTKAAACILEEAYAKFLPSGVVPLIHTSPLRAYAQVVGVFYPIVEPSLPREIHPSACIASSARLGRNIAIGPYVVIGEQVVLGDNVTIGAQTLIQAHVHIGDDTFIDAHVRISHSTIGKKVCILPGVRIGQSGFGFYMDRHGPINVPHIGTVVIGDDVEIGANTTIDRGSLNHTIIGEGTRIDNLVQIGHNVTIGKRCILVAQVGIAGSTDIGNDTIIAGQVGISGHLKIGARVKIAAKSGVVKDIQDDYIMGGIPAVPIKKWHCQIRALAKLIKKSS